MEQVDHMDHMEHMEQMEHTHDPLQWTPTFPLIITNKPFMSFSPLDYWNSEQEIGSNEKIRRSSKF